MKNDKITNDLEEIKMAIVNKREIDIVRDKFYSYNLRISFNY